MTSRITSQYRLDLEVLSPVHVGSGHGHLVEGYDFVADGDQVYVMDVDRLLERIPDDKLAQWVDLPVASLIERGAYPEYARYVLPNPERALSEGQGAEILEQTKDVFGRPYLPGSSLKGAFRTALLWAALRPEDAGRLGPEGDRRQDPRSADDRLERAVLPGQPEPRPRGYNPPNYDLLRAVRVEDMQVAPGGPSLSLAVAAVYSLRGDRLEAKGQGYRTFLEVLPPGLRLSGGLSLDHYLFSAQAAGLGLQSRATWVRDGGLLERSRSFARALIDHEAWFSSRYAPSPAITDFYEALQRRAAGLTEHETLLQAGWGTGWNAKTVAFGGWLSVDGLRQIIDTHQLDSGRQAPVFPKTRRYVEAGNAPALPLGWVKVSLTPAAERSSGGQP